MNNIRVVPQEDCKYIYNSMLIDKEYPDATFCECGYTIYFKNRKPHETVQINCKKCGGKIIYG